MVLIYLAFYWGAAWAADGATAAVDQAQALALKKNRQEACALLQQSIKDTPAVSKNRPKLAEALNNISKMFFTDKGQKAYEAGQAAMWDSPDLALTHFRTALANEDNNIQVLNNITRVYLMKQDCDPALQNILNARKLNPLNGEAAVLELRAYACQKRYEVLREKAKDLPALDKWEAAYVDFLLAQDSFQQKSFRKAHDSLTRITETEPQFPESYLALARSGSEIGKDVEPFLQKYISLCKAVTVRERKKYSLEPRLCTGLKEAEDELAKKAAEI